jgi:uncharacterized protein (UPF0332 family)
LPNVQALARLAKAREFLAAAALAEDAGLFDPAASAAVLAGIAAADAIVLHWGAAPPGRRAHDEAPDLLAHWDPTAAETLRRLLRVKQRAQYDARPVSVSEAADAVRRAERLVTRAEAKLTG